MIEQHNGKDTWKTSIETAKGHFDEGLRELAKAAEQAKAQGQDTWRNAMKKAQETWVEVREKGLDTWDETREQGEELLINSQRYIRRYPGKAVGLTALFGLFLGIFLSSGRNRTD